MDRTIILTVTETETETVTRDCPAPTTQPNLDQLFERLGATIADASREQTEALTGAIQDHAVPHWSTSAFGILGILAVYLALYKQEALGAIFNSLKMFFLWVGRWLRGQGPDGQKKKKKEEVDLEMNLLETPEKKNKRPKKTKNGKKDKKRQERGLKKSFDPDYVAYQAQKARNEERQRQAERALTPDPYHH